MPDPINLPTAADLAKRNKGTTFQKAERKEKHEITPEEIQEAARVYHHCAAILDTKFNGSPIVIAVPGFSAASVHYAISEYFEPRDFIAKTMKDEGVWCIRFSLKS